MPDRVDPAVKEVEAPGAAAVLDRARTQADLRELRPRDHTVLPGGQFGQFRVGCAALGLTMRLNTAHPVHDGASPPDERPAATLSAHLNAQFVTNRDPTDGFGSPAGSKSQ